MDSRTNLETCPGQGSCADIQRLPRVQLLPAGICLRRARSASCTVKGLDGIQPHVIHVVLVDAVLRQEERYPTATQTARLGDRRRHLPMRPLSDRSSSAMANVHVRRCSIVLHVRWQNNTVKNRFIDHGIQGLREQHGSLASQ